MKVSPGILDQGLNTKTTEEIYTPFVGAKAHVAFLDRWFCFIEGDFGVFDDSEVEETYQVIGAIGYRFTMMDIASKVIAGYLYLDLENNDIAVEVEVKGPFVGLGIEF